MQLDSRLAVDSAPRHEIITRSESGSIHFKWTWTRVGPPPRWRSRFHPESALPARPCSQVAATRSGRDWIADENQTTSLLVFPCRNTPSVDQVLPDQLLFTFADRIFAGCRVGQYVAFDSPVVFPTPSSSKQCLQLWSCCYCFITAASQILFRIWLENWNSPSHSLSLSVNRFSATIALFRFRVEQCRSICSMYRVGRNVCLRDYRR